MDQFEEFDAAVDSALEDAEASGGSTAEIKASWQDTQRAFDAFKAANDRAIEERRTRGAVDPVTAGQVERLNAELDRLAHQGAPEAKALRPRSHAPQGDTVKQAMIEIGKEVLRQGQVIDRMAARGPRQAGRMAELEAKARAIRARTAARPNLAEVKRDRPPGLGARLPGSRGGPADRVAAAYKQAIMNWIRTGQEEFRGHRVADLYLAVYGRKAQHTELNPVGGYLVDVETRGGAPLEAAMAELSPFRGIVTRHTLTEGDVLAIPKRTKRGTAGWVAERDARPPTGDSEFGLTSIPVMELYSEPEASQRWLDHVDSDIETWLVNWVAEDFALMEGPAFITGVGLTQPLGLLTAPSAFVLNHSQWQDGKFRAVTTGAAGAFAAAPNGGDVLIDCQASLKTGHQPNARWLMNRLTTGLVRKLKDSNGAYLWQPGIAAGAPPTLLASPITEEPNMPDVGTDTVSIGFGDWAKTYTIVEKGGVKMLRDPYSNKPMVRFYCSKLVGGNVVSFDAAIFVQFSA